MLCSINCKRRWTQVFKCCVRLVWGVAKRRRWRWCTSGLWSMPVWKRCKPVWRQGRHLNHPTRHMLGRKHHKPGASLPTRRRWGWTLTAPTGATDCWPMWWPGVSTPSLCCSPWRARACAVWAGPAFLLGANGASCAINPGRVTWPSTSTRASPAPSKTGCIWSATRIAFWRARSWRPRWWAASASTFTCAMNTTAAAPPWPKRWPSCKPSHRVLCPTWNCAAVLVPTFVAKSQRCWRASRGAVASRACAHPILQRRVCGANPLWRTTLKPCTGCATLLSAGRRIFPNKADMGARDGALSVSAGVSVSQVSSWHRRASHCVN